MAKAPREGEVKTRLVPPLSAAAAASLASCFVRDTVVNAQRVVTDLLVAYSPYDGRQTLESILPERLLWLEQQGEGLGTRLAATIAYGEESGYDPLIVIGADSPTTPTSFIKTAIDSLAAGESDLVLGPTDDGGYYLIGLRKPHGDLFQNVQWSTPLAYQNTVCNATRLKLRTLELPRWYDVDTFDDLLRMREEVFSNEVGRSRAVATYEWLTANDSLLSRLACTRSRIFG